MAPRAAAAAAPAGSGKPARGWDATSHEDLLLALLEEIKPNKADLTNVAAKMRSKGYSYSYDAINQHVQKLRKNRDTTTIQNSGGSENGPPRKRAAGGTKTPAKRTPSKRKATKSASVVDEDEDLEDEKMQLKMETDDVEEELMSPKGAKRTKSEPEDEVTVGEI